MQNFISICRLVEPAKRAGYWLDISKSDAGTCISMYEHGESLGERVYSLRHAKENQLSKAVEAVREIIARPTPIFPNGEHLEFEKVDIVVSGDWRNGEMIVTAEGDIFNLLSDDQMNEIMRILV